MVEKSTIPNMGEFMGMEFQVTWVWEGEVPRNEAVDSVARPYDLMNNVLLCPST